MIGETERIEADPCLVAVEKGKVERRTRTLEALGEGQVRVRTEVSMVSTGTELHHLQATHTRPSEFPMFLGYLTVGRIVGIGDGVANDLKLGQRVLVHEPHGASHNTDARSIRPVPEGVDPVDACCAVLLGVSLRGIRGGKVQLGDSVAVFGLGVIGQFAVHLAKLSGSFPVIAVDPVAHRRDIARKMAADAVIDPVHENVRDRIAALTDGERARISIDASGTPKVIAGLPELTAEFGRLVILGGVHGLVPMDLYTHVQKRNLTLVGCGSAFPTDYPHDVRRNELTLLAMIQAGIVRPRPTVTHVVPWTEGPTMYDLLMSRNETTLGVAFDWTAG